MPWNSNVGPARCPRGGNWRERAIALRKKLGVTQTEFGKMLGLARITILSWELGTRSVTRNLPEGRRIRNRIKKLEALAESVAKENRPAAFSIKTRKGEVIRID